MTTNKEKQDNVSFAVSVFKRLYNFSETLTILVLGISGGIVLTLLVCIYLSKSFPDLPVMIPNLPQVGDITVDGSGNIKIVTPDAQELKKQIEDAQQADFEESILKEYGVEESGPSATEDKPSNKGKQPLMLPEFDESEFSPYE